jgi:hypothetical protein
MLARNCRGRLVSVETTTAMTIAIASEPDRRRLSLVEGERGDRMPYVEVGLAD